MGIGEAESGGREGVEVEEKVQGRGLAKVEEEESKVGESKRSLS